MDKLKVAVLGVGSIGEFHSREFKEYGCEVVAILTKTKKSAYEGSKKLKEKYNINAKPYSNLDELLSKEKIDAVSICTPTKFHSAQVKKCLEYNLHVLCEKPFILDSYFDNYKIAKELIKLAREKRKILSVNTQLVSLLNYLPKDLDLNKIESFSMYMEPSIGGAINLMSEVLPHMNSLIIRLTGNNDIKNIKFPIVSDEHVKIQFKYGNCNVEYDIGMKEERPRKLKFSINGREFERKIGEEYKQQIISNGYSKDIDDPLKISIQKFVDSIMNKGKPLIEKQEILENVNIQDEILKSYLSSLFK